MKVKIIFVVTLMVFFTGIGNSWWNQSWEYRKPVEVSEQEGNILPNYTLSFTVDTSNLVSEGKLKSDGDDLRIIGSDNSQVLEYYIDSGLGTSSTKIKVQIPKLSSGSTKTIYMYYGNSEALSGEANPNSVDYVIYEDFESHSTGTEPSEMTGWYAGSKGSNAFVDDQKTYEGSKSMDATSDNDIGNYNYYEVLQKDFSPELPGKIKIGAAHWDDGNTGTRDTIWAKDDGTNIAGVGNDNPQLNWAIGDTERNRVSNGFSGRWYYTEMTIDTYNDQVDFYWNDGSSTWNANNKATNSVEGVSTIGCGGNGQFWCDKIQVSYDVNNPPTTSVGEEQRDSICDKRGAENECIVNSTRDISGDTFEVQNTFISDINARFESKKSSAKLDVFNSSILSGTWIGSFNITSEQTIIRPGANFRPENGNILIN